MAHWIFLYIFEVRPILQAQSSKIQALSQGLAALAVAIKLCGCCAVYQTYSSAVEQVNATQSDH